VEALYDAGCDTIAKLNLKKFKDTLSPGAERGLKYIVRLESPVPRENAEAIVVRCCSHTRLGYKFNEDQPPQNFCNDFVPTDGCEVIIAGD
jgi:hypothetical protein